MSGVVPIYLGQQMLHDALDMCDQLEIDQGKNETIDLLRDKTNALLQADLEERERAREEVEESQDASEAEDEGEDGGIWLEDAVEDAMMGLKLDKWAELVHCQWNLSSLSVEADDGYRPTQSCNPTVPVAVADESWLNPPEKCARSRQEHQEGASIWQQRSFRYSN
ncbi:hypothetical protein LTR78_009073 [Recurvomyces mirabilis]|uniref:Uncharacterized protein n=1 Tax=Recurvomyces mirabilis TaxID=574656 RepID=A0AAE0TSF1_9PEZI|nr:hypothetical protein LTR78_009073 [Recurvomyces mirabilis]